MSVNWSEQPVLITGGLGFIGSTLAHRLVALGADVTLVDAMLPLYGGNLANIQGIESQVRVNYADIRDMAAMEQLVAGRPLVFHLASQVSHVDSIQDPFPDLDINVRGTLVLLEAMRPHAPEGRVIYVGTRGQYGPNQELPVAEDAPSRPHGMYEITKQAAESCIGMYHRVHGIQAVSLRLVNTYGPRHQMKHDRYGVVNWFVRKVLSGEPIPIFGDGSLLRDLVYVDDAVGAIIAAAESETAWGNVYNVGSGVGTSFLDVAKTIVAVAGEGEIAFREFTKERLAMEPGDYVADVSKIRRDLKWEASTALEEGLGRTIEFYRQHRDRYWQQ
jgi:UDP-glucose 4-epimerase